MYSCVLHTQTCTMAWLFLASHTGDIEAVGLTSFGNTICCRQLRDLAVSCAMSHGVVPFYYGSHAKWIQGRTLHLIMYNVGIKSTRERSLAQSPAFTCQPTVSQGNAE